MKRKPNPPWWFVPAVLLGSFAAAAVAGLIMAPLTQ